MTRRLPLGAWLALGLTLAVLVPATGAIAAWWVVESRQQAALERRADRAAMLLARAARRPLVGTKGTLEPSLSRALDSLDVEVDFGNSVGKETVGVGKTSGVKVPFPAKDVGRTVIRRENVTGPLDKPREAMTPGLQLILQRPNGKQSLQNDFVQRDFPGGNLFIRKPSTSTRIAAAVITALLLLLLVLLAGYALLRRWVVRPLAQLSLEIDRVAGGGTVVGPVSSPALEVAEVAAALSGMAEGLRNALAERDAAENRRKFLITSVAHDLRTPLFTLRGSLEAIEHGIGDADHLARAQDKATLLDSLVDDLFTYSRLEYAHPELAHEPLDALALANDAAQTVSSRIVVTAPADGVVVHGDRASLLRVLVNLLDNAVRYARSRVELRVGREGDAVAFEVIDDGPGIDPEDLPHLFEPLFRSDRTRNSTTGGAGLGLAIVDRLVTAAGATVSVAGAPGGGARFTVRFPRRPAVEHDGARRAQEVSHR